MYSAKVTGLALKLQSSGSLQHQKSRNGTSTMHERQMNIPGHQG